MVAVILLYNQLDSNSLGKSELMILKIKIIYVNLIQYGGFEASFIIHESCGSLYTSFYKRK